MDKIEIENLIKNNRETIKTIQEEAEKLCIEILKNEFGGSINFDWEDGDAPSFSSVTFSDDLTDAYITHLFVDGDTLKADLYAYYFGDETKDVMLAREYEVDYLDILDYLNNHRDEDDKELKHCFVDTKFGEVMLKEQNNRMYVDIYNGDNYDNYLGEFEGNVYDDSLAELIRKAEEVLGGDDY